MGVQENLAAAKRGYAAFRAGDPVTAMAEMVDEIEWITPGNSAVSGTVRGKEALGEHWARFAPKGYSVEPEYWFADGDRVVVLVRHSYAGEDDTDAADVLTFNADGKLVKFQSAGDTALLERVFGSK
jgi:ketosteroid isomerase-like protein